MRRIKESQDYKFAIDERFPWSEEIISLCDRILEKAPQLKKDFNYNRHRREGFEFNIKAKWWPDIDAISKKYGYSEDEIYEMWDQFLADNLQMWGDDIIENSAYFEDWFQEGRSGGWLVLNYKSELIEYTESDIDEEISDLNYMTESMDEAFNKIYIDGIGFLKILNSLKKSGIDVEHLESSFEDMEDKSKSVISSLKEKLSELEKIGAELEDVQSEIKKFWENSKNYFNDYIENENEWRGSN